MESALRNIKILEDKDFFNFKISVKSSDVFLSIGAYRQLSKVCDYPLHLGITEAGSFCIWKYKVFYRTWKSINGWNWRYYKDFSIR